MPTYKDQCVRYTNDKWAVYLMPLALHSQSEVPGYKSDKAYMVGTHKHTSPLMEKSRSKYLEKHKMLMITRLSK